MGRTRRIRSQILRVIIYISAIYTICCCKMENVSCDTAITFHCTLPESRSSSPDEDMISDISLMIFDGNGDAEEHRWLEGGEMGCTVRLIAGKCYTFCVCANFGYPINAGHIDELQDIRYRMAYPDEYREGIPMYAEEDIMIAGDGKIDIGLQRLMAKISIRMDRSRLDDEVEMMVRAIRIGNCPRYVTPFNESRTESPDDCFPVGFSLNDLQTESLNTTESNGQSGEVSVYMFENMQGLADRHLESDGDKVFDNHDIRSRLCSFIEMEIEYMSTDKKSGEKGLLYRFYLGENRNSFDIRRNTHYHITVTPEKDGLAEDSWRVDKSGLEDISPSYLKAYPSDYIRGDIGDRIHIWCEFSPENAPFDVGITYMEDDKAEGIYDYIVDEDGHGAVLTLTGPGSGLIYMEAGEPINEAALFIIEVNQP